MRGDPSHDWDRYCRSMEPHDSEPELPHECEPVEFEGHRFCGLCGCNMPALPQSGSTVSEVRDA